MAVIQKQSTARPVKTQLTESGVAKKPLATIARPINAQLTESGVAKQELLTEAQVVQNLTESSFSNIKLSKSFGAFVYASQMPVPPLCQFPSTSLPHAL